MSWLLRVISYKSSVISALHAIMNADEHVVCTAQFTTLLQIVL